MIDKFKSSADSYLGLSSNLADVKIVALRFETEAVGVAFCKFFPLK